MKGKEVDAFYKEKADMSWNYRVIETEWGYEIREVYYTDGEPVASTAGAVGCCGESLEELEEDLKLRIKALDKPVLDRHIFNEGGGDF